MEEAENQELQNNEGQVVDEATAAGQEQSPSGSELKEGGQTNPEVEAVRRELGETRERYVRLMAEFENYKKRSLKEQSELLKYQGERIILDLLEVLDNLDLALTHSSAEHDKLKAGLEMIHKMFVERLNKWEIRGEPGLGTQFDPQKHSAISRVPGSDAKPGTIVGELKKAYYYKDKLIRPGEVVVAADTDK